MVQRAKELVLAHNGIDSVAHASADFMETRRRLAAEGSIRTLVLGSIRPWAHPAVA